MTYTIPAGAFTIPDSIALNEFIREQQPNLQQCLKFVEDRGVEMKPAVVEQVEDILEFSFKRTFTLADGSALNDFISDQESPELEMCLKFVEDRGVEMTKKVRSTVKAILLFALA